MLFRSFAHWLLVIFSLTLLAILAVGAGELGLLGEAFRGVIDQAWQLFQDFYEPRSFVLDPAVKVIGFAGTVLGAVWTVHKGWHYAEQNLPKRLKEYNEQRRGQTIVDRRGIPALARVVSIAPQTFPELSPLLKLVHWIYDPDRRALDLYEKDLELRTKEFEVLSNTRVRLRAEVITAHLARGAQLARVSPDRGNDALDTFKKAISFNRSDLDALELAAKQYFALNNRKNSRDHLSALANAAEKAGDSVRQARAFRFHAETLEVAQRADRELARGLLAEAISLLQAANVRDVGARDVELGLAHLQLAEVQIYRERFYAARAALNSARILVGGSELPGVRGRLKEIESRLRKTERDPENTEETD